MQRSTAVVERRIGLVVVDRLVNILGNMLGFDSRLFGYLQRGQ